MQTFLFLASYKYIDVQEPKKQNSSNIQLLYKLPPDCLNKIPKDDNKMIINTVDSRYLEFKRTLKNTSRYPYFDISDL